MQEVSTAKKALLDDECVRIYPWLKQYKCYSNQLTISTAKLLEVHNCERIMNCYTQGRTVNPQIEHLRSNQLKTG